MTAPPARLFVFTLHRCASMLLHAVCLDLAQANRMRYYSPNSGGRRVPLRRLATDRALLRKPGCFCPLRIPIDVPDLDEAKVLLHLRDPRDVLVSMFFSYCFSHPGEIPGATGYRQEMAEKGIDDFVLLMATAEEKPVVHDYGTGAHVWDLAGNIAARYRRYVDELIGRSNVTLLRYEDMVVDFADWLRRLAAGFDEGADPTIIDQLRAKYAPTLSVSREDKWSHRRRVTPGDFREKLRPETIDRLNAVFDDVITRLDYPR